jgi:hypothetical protein
MKKPRSKTPDPIIPDPTLEEKMKSLASATRTALVKTEDVRVESIRHPQGDRLAVRAANGKFTKLTTAVAARDARDAQNFLAEKVKDELGNERTRKAHLREALYSGAIKASQSDKGLGPAVKSFEALNEDAALTQAKESMITSANQEVQNPVRIVMINMPTLMVPEIQDGDKPKERPKAPSFAEVLDIRTNPPQE